MNAEIEEKPFEHVPAGLGSALTRQGFLHLTPVQEAVLDPQLADCDLRISSQTGSGKTVALGLVVAPVLQEWNDETQPAQRRQSERGPRRSGPAQPWVLLIAPTRELAQQLRLELSWLFRPLRADVAAVTGGTSLQGDFVLLGHRPAVLVGTPGRLADHVERGTLDLSQLKALVLDEADEMLDLGFRDELEAIVDRAPKDRRTHMVSATFPREVLNLARRFQQDAVAVAGDDPSAAHDDIRYLGHWVRPPDRTDALINVLLQAPQERTLVFVRTREQTATLAQELAGLGFAARALSGDMTQRERTATVAAFRAGHVKIQVATDVAARGLDIPDITRVIHYDLPEHNQALTHRSGRTGRAGKKGTSVLLASPRARRHLADLQRRTGVKIDWQPLPDAEAIQRAARGRVLEELTTALSTPGGECSDGGHHDLDGEKAELEITARALLEQHDAVHLVARLLERGDFFGPCPPRQVAPIPDGRKPRRPREGRDGIGQGSDEQFVPFFVNWGGRQGANANRLLAMACRRGEVTRDDIGAIRVDDRCSLIEVSVRVADDFARAAGKRDTRNPGVAIRPWRGEAPSRHVGPQRDPRAGRRPPPIRKAKKPLGRRKARKSRQSA
jgi:ATP-dependent RNA helicase DeaD